MFDLRPALTNLSAKAVAVFMIMELEHLLVVRHPPPLLLSLSFQGIEAVSGA
jgi:hypothetical protein